jgi:hypothetical protein
MHIHTFVHYEGGYGGKRSPIIKLSVIFAGHLLKALIPSKKRAMRLYADNSGYLRRRHIALGQGVKPHKLSNSLRVYAITFNPCLRYIAFFLGWPTSTLNPLSTKAR